MQTQNTQELRKLLEGKEEEAMTPSALVGRYGKFFPFKAMIMKGFYNNRAEIVAGEIYNIHFLKNARVISIVDSSGQRYSNSHMRDVFLLVSVQPTHTHIYTLMHLHTNTHNTLSPTGMYYH